MSRRYVTLDVFTDRAFGGNPLAVVLDAEGMTSERMQEVAREFGYTETTFVLPPEDPAHDARVRIFTPDREIGFAGHPNVGTACALAAERGTDAARLRFEEGAGLVPVSLLREGGAVVGAEVEAPVRLALGAEAEPALAAACLSLEPGTVRTAGHAPLVASVGLPFLVVELASRAALARARPDPAGFDAVLPLDGARSVYAYTRDVPEAEAGTGLQARMFTRRMTEDPATGSATAATVALLARLAGAPVTLRVGQGYDMGRPSLMLASAEPDGCARVGGRCVPVMEGRLVATE